MATMTTVTPRKYRRSTVLVDVLAVAALMTVGVLAGRASVTPEDHGTSFTGTVSVVNQNQTAVSIRDAGGNEIDGILANNTGSPLTNGESVRGTVYDKPNIVYVTK